MPTWGISCPAYVWIVHMVTMESVPVQCNHDLQTFYSDKDNTATKVLTYTDNNMRGVAFDYTADQVTDEGLAAGSVRYG